MTNAPYLYPCFIFSFVRFRCLPLDFMELSEAVCTRANIAIMVNKNAKYRVPVRVHLYIIQQGYKSNTPNHDTHFTSNNPSLSNTFNSSSFNPCSFKPYLKDKRMLWASSPSA